MDSTVCPYCSKKFCSSSTKNRHIKNVHSRAIVRSDTKKGHIYCPLCIDEKKEIIATYILLIKHLLDVHNIVVKQEKLQFANYDDFEIWRELQQQDVNYTKQCVVQTTIDTKVIYFNCNRSNSRGTQSNCSKRLASCKGSIKIDGVCPSRIIVRHRNSGEVEVDYFETHVGHDSELCHQRLTSAEQKEVSEKLKAGVSTDRIIRDARKLKENKLRRINLLNIPDLAYLQKKFKIEKRRDFRHKSTDTLVDKAERKMWSTILKKYRPTTNNSKSRKISKALRAAKNCDYNRKTESLSIGKPSEEQLKTNEAIDAFVKEKCATLNNDDDLNLQDNLGNDKEDRKIVIESMRREMDDIISSLDDATFEKFEVDFKLFISKFNTDYLQKEKRKRKDISDVYRPALARSTIAEGPRPKGAPKEP